MGETTFPAPHRADGLTPGERFFVILLFDRGGFYTSILAPTESETMAKAAQRIEAVKSINAQSPLYEGRWDGHLPDISMPEEARVVCGALFGNRED